MSEPKKITVSTKESEILLGEAMDLAEMGNWEWNLASGKVNWSKNIYKIYELDPGKDVPNYELFVDCIHNEDRPKVLEIIQNAIENKEPYELSYRIKLDSGTIKFIDAKAIPRLSRDNQLDGYFGIVQDVTRRQKAEARLQKTEQIAMTGRVARMIAHEIRNPLTNINLALEPLKEDLDEEATTYTDLIARNTVRINDLITSLLASTRSAELHYSTCDIHNIIDGAILLANDRIKLRGINLEKCYDNAIPMAQLDAEKLKIAFLNIVLNGIDAMPDNKGILRIETMINGEELELAFKDNGSGIEKGSLDRLFDPFYTEKSGGMGLGLTSVQNVIHSHNGSIEVESELGDGTTFTVYLPLPE